MSRGETRSLDKQHLDSPLAVRVWWPYPPIARWVERWRARGDDRRFLASLSDHALRDIGLDRVDVDTESTQSFWRQRYGILAIERRAATRGTNYIM